MLSAGGSVGIASAGDGAATGDNEESSIPEVGATTGLRVPCC